MTSYTVQFILPVDNPVSNVSMTRSKGVVHFEVPLNHPEAHKMGFMDLVASAELSGLFTVSPTLIKNREKKLESLRYKESAQVPPTKKT